MRAREISPCSREASDCKTFGARAADASIRRSAASSVRARIVKDECKDRVCACLGIARVLSPALA